MSEITTTPFGRRGLLAGAGVAAGVALSPFAALAANTAHAAPGQSSGNRFSYGDLAPVKDRTTGLELLLLPKGFEYISYGWTGDLMADGVVTPSSHDGMATFRAESAKKNGKPANNNGRGNDDLVTMVRNHERGAGAAFTSPNYDPQAGGGTTTLTFDSVNGKWLDATSSLGGTIRNCAGGPTPWGTWLSCEETTLIQGSYRHGYVFEVPGDGSHATAEPIRAMGRFSHEAVCVDPKTGIIYQTEDTGSSLIYRYLPTEQGNPAAGGKLQAMKVDAGDAHATRDDVTGTQYKVSWIDIDNPDPGATETSTAVQGRNKGAALISRGEGAWWGNDRAYFVSTNGGPARLGQVFEYDPKKETMVVLYASPNAATLDAPDNVTVSPRGGLVLCEDGGGEQYLRGLTTDGRIFDFAKNNVDLRQGTAGKNVSARDYRGYEWCGATFGGRKDEWLFVNIQTPGITFAITGPWQDGAL
ncbi:alkaline phosphatase PhoX [Granulicoccus phenolivorans]|uniref:alkaline phosphatase PhoX n=1 Tax=Granulicoccus phenolivorans TaxID=266854 RepID=UPI00040CA562|nr:alkaline phosphatase PhoX [Granulicoccus phenolivorans]